MEILVATENTHKLKELSAIFAGHTLLTPHERDIDYYFEETGETFLANAQGKALALFEKVRLEQALTPVIADDSGLVVPALGGEPGVYSARYGSPAGGPNLDTPDRNRYLLDKMEGLTDRRSFFVCCMVLVLTPERFFVAQETLPGSIISEPRGNHGFGYDPLFYLNEYGQTVAELPEAEKNKISHRGRAGIRLRAVLDSL
ncbi:MAG: RdgB/HAM1 family non-canonical purine NTP pyrophosphatase [Spirochaetia bacterium]|nr:RdgB/HAM1 family non-canonical purine NTP pyrophosphatase [Spirochaetia bacterium]